MTDFDAVVLAAGAGSRFGGGKMLAPFRGGPLVTHALASAFASGARRVVLVCGADAEAVGREAYRYAAQAGRAPKLSIVDVPDYADGLSTSLKAGVAALPEDSIGAFIFLGDMPLIPPGLPQHLAGELVSKNALIAAPVHSATGKRGHPVLFSHELFGKIIELSGDVGANQILETHRSNMVLVDTNKAGIMFDIDYNADLSSAPES